MSTGSANIRYFTCEVGGGFTSQLFQFSTLYKLGRSLGLEYVHYPFECRRSSAQLNTLLSLDRYLMDRSESPDRFASEPCLVRLTNANLGADVASLADLQCWVRAEIDGALRNHGSNSEIVRFSLTGQARLRYRSPRKRLSRLFDRGITFSKRLFRCQGAAVPGKPRGRIVEIVQQAIPQLPDGLDLRQACLESVDDRHLWPDAGDDKKKVLVHIRQGDTAVIETPWKTFIPVWKFKEIREVSSRSELPHRQLDTSEFLPMLEALSASSSRNSVIVCSDGYDRAFDKMFRRMKAHRGLSEDQLRQLARIRIDYDDVHFDPIRALKGVRCVVGETDENLATLIAAALTADVVIFGTQQRLIPKLMACCYERGGAPLLIQLHKTRRPLSHCGLGLDPERFGLGSVRADAADMAAFVSGLGKPV